MSHVLHQLLKLESTAQWRTIPSSAEIPAWNAAEVSFPPADAHWGLLDADELVGRCSLWWQNTPAYDSHRVGIIGHYAAADDVAGSTLLAQACEELARAGCTLAVGPMDGTTWQNYRFVTEGVDASPFFLEPSNPPDWPVQFISHGFQPLAHYFSAICYDLTRVSGRTSRVARQLSDIGVSIRALDDERFEEDLAAILAVVHASFRDNLLFAEMTRADFLRQFEQLRGIVPLDLILIAEQHGTPVGFAFAIPDLLQAERGETIDTVILKTLGVLPRREFAGLGQLLLEQIQHRAAELGYRRAIHALVRDKGHLERISARYAVPFRRYTLLARELC